MKTPVLTVSAAPHWHKGAAISTKMYGTMLVLVPAAAAGIYNYGAPALGVIGVAVASAVLAEALMQLVMGQKLSIGDGSAALCGLILALLLPAGAPWWLVMMGAFSAIIIGKQIFGGLGSSPMNPALVGWVIIRLSWALDMDVDASMIHCAGVSGLSALAALKGGVFQHGLGDLFFGRVLGDIGSATGLILLGGIAAASLRLIKWQVSAAFLIGAFLASLLFRNDMLPVVNDVRLGAVDPFTFLFAGHVMIGAFFLATDHPSSPAHARAMGFYGFSIGFLAILIQVYGKYYDGGVIFAVLLMNLATPLFDKIRPKAIGRA